MSYGLVNNSLTKLGFEVTSYPERTKILRRPEYSSTSLLDINDSLIGGSSAPSKSNSKPKISVLDSVMRKSPALHKMYKKMGPTITKMMPIAQALKDKKITVPFKNDKSKSFTLGHVGNYKTYSPGELQEFKHRGLKVGPSSLPLYGIKFTKTF